MTTEYVIDHYGPVQDGAVYVPHDRHIVYTVDEFGMRHEQREFADEVRARAWARQQGWVATTRVKARDLRTR